MKAASLSEGDRNQLFYSKKVHRMRRFLRPASVARRAHRETIGYLHETLTLCSRWKMARWACGPTHGQAVHQPPAPLRRGIFCEQRKASVASQKRLRGGKRSLGLLWPAVKFRNTRAYARASLKSHRRRLARCDNRRDRAANRLDHVTLTPGAAALAVATDTLSVPFGHKATSPHSTGWAACAGRRCHAKAAVRPIS